MAEEVILLTGASGYVGGRLRPILAASGRRLRCLVRSPGILTGVAIGLLSVACGSTENEADGRSAQAATAIAESKPAGNLYFPKDLNFVAVSLVDSVSLRYRLLLTSAPDSLAFAPSEALFAIRADSVADLQNIDTYSSENADYNVSAANIPAALQAQPVRRKKALFFTALKPIASFHNSILDARHRRLARLAEQAEVAAVDEQFIADMSKLYRLKAMPTHRDTLRELLVKVGPIPPSLALAQAAIESGWGSSRFSQQGNNLYGQRIWSKKAGGIVAKGAKDARFRLASFPTIAASVRSYMHNLNSHPAYQTLRKERALLRRQGEAITGEALAGGLMAYSTRGEDYIDDVRQMIRHNNLQDLDTRVD